MLKTRIQLAAFCAAIALQRARLVLANAKAVYYEDGQKTFITDAAVATRNFVFKAGSDADHAAASAADTDFPLGISPDTASAAEKPITIRLFGACKGTEIGVANAAITVGDELCSAGNGKVKTIPTTTWTGYVIGRALATVAAGNEVPFTPCFPQKRIVS